MKNTKNPLLSFTKNKHARWIAFLTTLLLWPSISYGSEDESFCKGGLCATPVKKGHRAPFDGQLITMELALSLGSKLELCNKDNDLVLDAEKRLCDLAISQCKEMSKIESDAFSEKIDLCQKKLEEMDPWYREPWFVSALTFVATMSTVYAAGRVLNWTP